MLVPVVLSASEKLLWLWWALTFLFRCPICAPDSPDCLCFQLPHLGGTGTCTCFECASFILKYTYMYIYTAWAGPGRLTEPPLNHPGLPGGVPGAHIGHEMYVISFFKFFLRKSYRQSRRYRDIDFLFCIQAT